MRWLPLVLLAACGPEEKACTNLYAYGLNVTVVDSATEAPLCSATVEVRDGDYKETLMAFPGNTCTYVGAGERPGTYIIEASSDGYAITATGATVKKDASGCHVSGEVVTVKLRKL